MRATARSFGAGAWAVSTALDEVAETLKVFWPNSNSQVVRGWTVLTDS